MESVLTCSCAVAPTLTGTVDLGLAWRHVEERMSVVPVFVSQSGGGKERPYEIPLRSKSGIFHQDRVQLGPLRLTTFLLSRLTWADPPYTGALAQGAYESRNLASTLLVKSCAQGCKHPYRRAPLTNLPQKTTLF